jgi:hypothetical protein
MDGAEKIRKKPLTTPKNLAKMNPAILYRVINAMKGTGFALLLAQRTGRVV